MTTMGAEADDKRTRRRGMAPPWRDVLPPVLLGMAALAAGLPTLRLFAPFMDEGALLAGAARLLAGGVFFRDVDAYPLPGAWYLLAAVMRICGQSLVVARGLDAVLFAAATVLAYVVGRRIMGGYLAALLGVALVAVKYWAWPLWSIYVYPDVAIVLALGGVLAFLGLVRGGRMPAAFAAGLLFGLAALCKQTVGIYPGLAGVGLLVALGKAGPARRWQALGWYAGGGILAIALPFAAFAEAGMGRLFAYNALIRPFTGYLPQSGLPYGIMLRVWEFGRVPDREIFPYLTPMAWTAIYHYAIHSGVWLRSAALAAEAVARAIFLLMPAGFLAAGALLARARREWTLRHTEALVVWLLAGAITLSVFPRADYPHLLNLAPVWLVVVFLAGDLVARRVGVWGRRAVRGLAAASAGASLVGGLLLLWAIYATCTGHIEVPRAGRLRVDTRDNQVEVITRYVRAHTRPGEPLFVYGHEAYYYFLCDRYGPWRFPQLYPGMTGEGGGAELARLVERERIRYVIQGNVTMPGLPRPASYAPVLAAYIARHYRPVDLKFRGYTRPDILLERRD